MINTLICDDHAMVREALPLVLSQDDDIKVVGTTRGFSDSAELMGHERIDVALIDVRLADESGLALASWIRQTQPDCRVVLLTGRVSDEVLVEACKMGAFDVVEKNASATDLIGRVRSAANGRRMLDDSVMRAAQKRLEDNGVAALRRLGETDRQILRFIGMGMTDKQISERVYLSPQTVRNRISRLLSVLGRENRTQLALLHTQLDDAISEHAS